MPGSPPATSIGSHHATGSRGGRTARVSPPSWRKPALCCSILLSACALSASPERARATLVSIGSEPLDRLPLVPRLLVQGTFDLHPADLWLLRGSVSDKERSQILERAPSVALEGKRIPLAVWGEDGALSLAPLVVLEPGQEYSIVGLGWGELAEVSTSPKPTSIWWRWGQGAVRPGGWVVHCSEPPPWTAVHSQLSASQAGSGGEGTLGRRALFPAGVEVDILTGFSAAPGPGSCVRFQVPNGSATLLPPHEIDGRYFEPGVILIDAAAEALDEQVPAIRVHGSAAFLELPAVAAEVRVVPLAAGAGTSELLIRAEAEHPGQVPLGEFARGSYAATLALLDGLGQPHVHALSFEVEVEQGYPVLTEILANPLGPEPESEWVEIVNVGRAPLSLAGLQLEDSAGVVELPAVVLPPGAVGLVVRADFVAGASGDVVPTADALPIVVAELAEEGLSNSGEVVRLRALSGVVLSEIPAVPTTAGTSLARRHLLAPDWVSSFSPHAAPGASPGAENSL
jgi:hypothetical protein